MSGDRDMRIALLAGLLASAQVAGAEPWICHTIDDSSKGADGVRLADANGDGWLDIATGWEQGGLIRAYLNPGPTKVKARWPAVTVGKVGAPEDAVWADLDGDGKMDIVSCCEGHVKSVFVHWAPKEPDRLLDPAAWSTAAFPAVKDRQMFMFCLPLEMDGKHEIDLVTGSKGKDATIGWLQSPANPRDLDAWTWHPLYDARWVMSLVAADLDRDGDDDLLASDREGARRGCFWLENPGRGSLHKTWAEHRIGPVGIEATFLDFVDFDKDGKRDVLAPDFGRKLWFHRCTATHPLAWATTTLPYPEQVAFARSARAADIDLDGKVDVIMTSRGPEGKTGAVWMSYRRTIHESGWDVYDISGPAGPKGLKLDIIQLADLDDDGDLDLITTEEHSNLGVIWYENPTRH